MKMCTWRVLTGLALSAMALSGAGCASIHPPAGVVPFQRVLHTTAYCKCGQCCGWRRTWYGRPVYTTGSMKGKPKAVGITASGTKARRGTIAADTGRYPFGTVMQVEGYGFGRVEDRGGSIQGDRIDLFFGSHAEALRWGRRSIPVLIWYPPPR